MLGGGLGDFCSALRRGVEVRGGDRKVWWRRAIALGAPLLEDGQHLDKAGVCRAKVIYLLTLLGVASHARDRQVHQVVAASVVPRENMLQRGSNQRTTFRGETDMPLAVNALARPNGAPFLVLFEKPEGLIGRRRPQKEPVSSAAHRQGII